MASAFKIDKDGVPFIKADPDSDLDYSIATWLDGAIFQTLNWSITPTGPTLYNDSINDAPVTLGGVNYGIGSLASVWIRGPFVLGTIYTVTLHAVFNLSRIDDRSFRILCVER